MSSGLFSENNAKSEYLITEEAIDQGITDGKLHCKWRSYYGHAYRLLNRTEVEQYIKENPNAVDPKLVEERDQLRIKRAEEEVKMKLTREIDDRRKELKSAKAELAGMDNRKEFLKKRIEELNTFLANYPKEPAPPIKRGTKRKTTD
jgi:hypothetical protein